MKPTAAITEAVERLRREGRVIEQGAPPPCPIEERCTEAEFQAAIVKEAKKQGFKVLHVRDARKSEGEGWVDLFMVRVEPTGQGRALAWELKVGDNEPTADQSTWLELLAAIPGVEARLMRPSDWPEIVRLLAAPAPTPRTPPPAPPFQSVRSGINWHEVK